jgi:hypothetical protein
VNQPVFSEALKERNVPLGEVGNDDLKIGAALRKGGQVAIEVANRRDGTQVIAFLAN